VPFSYAQYAGNGSTTTFSVPFPYLLKAHVKLYTGFNILTGTFATELTEGTDFNWTSGTQVQVTVAPASGVTLTILRDTPDSSQLSSWQDGSNLIADDLNNADLQNLYVVQEQQDRNDAVSVQSSEAIAVANAATASSNAAASTAGSALITSNTALSNSNAAVTVANTAASNAASAVSTANAASTDAATAVATADAAAVTAASASTTANNAASTAGSAAANAAAALGTANTALSNASAATSVANTAASNAAAAVSTANAASNDASQALAAANTASGNASSALTAANSAASEAATATSFGIAANANALEAVAIANAASSAIGSAVLYTTIANPAAIPGTPVDGEAVEIIDSTGIESFAPLINIPSGFAGDPGLSVRLIYNDTQSSWVWIQYFPNDPEGRYLNLSGGTLTGQLFADGAGGAPSPGIAFAGDPNTGLAQLAPDELGLVTGGVARLTVDSAGGVDVPGALSSSGSAVVLDTDARLADARTPTDSSVTTQKIANAAVTSEKIAASTIVNGNISDTADISSSKLANSGVTAGTYGSSTQIPSLTINEKGIITSAQDSALGGGLVTTSDVGTVTDAMLAAETITDSSISPSANISGLKIAAASTTTPGVVQLYDGLDSTSASAAATANSVKTAYDTALGAVIPPGTVMLFVQTNAPTGWTKSTTHNNKALRVVSGTASSGGTTAFTSVFASRTPGGSIANTTAGGSISSTTAGGSVNGSNSGGSVNATTLTAAQMPTHSHQAGAQAGSDTVFFDTHRFSSESEFVSTAVGSNIARNRGTSNTGGSTSHTHGFTVPTWSGSFTGTSHGHTFTGSAHNHTFTGTAMDFAVQYVDVILATKN
jgi:hypothetical protein